MLRATVSGWQTYELFHLDLNVGIIPATLIELHILVGISSEREFRLRAPPWGGRGGGRGRWAGTKKIGPRDQLFSAPPQWGDWI